MAGNKQKKVTNLKSNDSPKKELTILFLVAIICFLTIILSSAVPLFIKGWLLGEGFNIVLYIVIAVTFTIVFFLIDQIIGKINKDNIFSKIRRKKTALAGAFVIVALSLFSLQNIVVKDSITFLPKYENETVKITCSPQGTSNFIVNNDITCVMSWVPTKNTFYISSIRVTDSEQKELNRIARKEFEGETNFTLFVPRDSGDMNISTTICNQTDCPIMDNDVRTINVLSQPEWGGVIRDRMTSMLGFIAALITICLFGVNQLWEVLLGKDA